MVRKGKGRQKIKMVKIKNESNLQVTFSKRRAGVFKKASELCTLCGVHILMIVFSPGGKAYSFGHPNVKDLIHRFLNHNHNSSFYQHNNNLQLIETHPDNNIQFLNKILIQELTKQENEKNKRMDLDKIREIRERKGNQYEKDVNELDLNETNHLISALRDLKRNLLSGIYCHISGSQNYLGESSNLFEQRRMVEMNAFKYDPNYRPSFGYYSNGVIVPQSNRNYMLSYNFNQS